MKKFFTYLLAIAAVTTVISCSKDDGPEEPEKPDTELSGKMNINGQTLEIKSAVYVDVVKEYYEDQISLTLYSETQFPTFKYGESILSATGAWIGINVSKSFFGKTVDLTQPFPFSGQRPIPEIHILARESGKGKMVGVKYIPDGSIHVASEDVQISDEFGEVVHFNPSPTAPVTAGSSLTLTRNGDKFTIKLSLTLNDGRSVSIDFEGKPTKETLSQEQ